LARIVHQFTAVKYDPVSLWQSVPLQVAYSVSWTVIGLVLTVWASRKARRVAWMVGAGLLGVVVIKLFFIDLGALSAGAKIGTFLAVGMLLMIVGYWAPVPPKARTAQAEE
jgi:uncharacterized membrane protein